MPRKNPVVSSSPLVFPLPNLLPAHQRLLLDPDAHLALLCSWREDQTFLPFRFFVLTPSAARVFLPLLQAYPFPCSYFTLFVALYPRAAQQEAWKWDQERDLMLSPVRRALKSLLPTFRTCGFQAISLRGRGYVLAAAAASQEHHVEAGPTPSCLSQTEQVAPSVWGQQATGSLISPAASFSPMMAMDRLHFEGRTLPGVPFQEASRPSFCETIADEERLPQALSTYESSLR